jgi:hypothetical protein
MSRNGGVDAVWSAVQGAGKWRVEVTGLKFPNIVKYFRLDFVRISNSSAEHRAERKTRFIQHCYRQYHLSCNIFTDSVICLTVLMLRAPSMLQYSHWYYHATTLLLIVPYILRYSYWVPYNNVVTDSTIYIAVLLPIVPYILEYFYQ